MKEFQQGAWEEAIGKGRQIRRGRTEGIVALWVHTGNTLPPARQFKADSVINQLANQGDI